MGPITRILFLGSKALGLRVVQELHALAPAVLAGVVTIDDRSDTRTVYDDFQAWASRAGVALHVARNRRHADELVARLRPELCFVVGWYWLIGAETLASVPHGFLGIHNSLLPRYRGGSPLVWAIINGEPEVGFSLFSFTPGMDDGPVWATGRTPLGPADQVADVLARLEAETVRVVRAVYPELLAGRACPTEQDHALATYCAQRFPDDGVIDWSQPAARVHNFARAQSEPYPGAFTLLDGRRLTVWRARPAPHVYHGTPGQVARVDPTGVTVICGDDRALVLEDVGLDGGRVPAAQVVTSIKTRFPRLPWSPGPG